MILVVSVLQQCLRPITETPWLQSDRLNSERAIEGNAW